MITVETTGTPPDSWPRLWAADPHASLFNHPRWLRALLAAYPMYRPSYLVARRDGAAVGVLPMVSTRRMGLTQVLSLPFGTHGGPLTDPRHQDEAALALASAFRKRAGGLFSLRFEMTVYNPSDGLRRALAPKLGDSFQEFRTHVVDLTLGFETLWEGRYAKNTRNCVRMAERAGITVAAEKGSDAVAILHRFHDAQSRAWEGIPPHPLAALNAISESFGEDCLIYVAREAGTPVAACLFLRYQDREIHPWVSGAAPAARKTRAFHLLMNNAIRESVDAGIATWNFGGSGGNPKIEFFKESFAGAPVPVLRCFHMAAWAKKLRRGPEWD